jgi:hypothetical protein
METRRWTRAVAMTGLAATVALGLASCGDDDDKATVSLTAPVEGATLAGGVQLSMSADGLTIEKAGEVRDGAGHFHVIADDGCGTKGAAVPRDADHVHFGAGQSEGMVYLEPGPHALCLQAGDGAHVALGVTDTVNVTVGVDTLDEWCAVVGEVDVLFTATDTSDEDFAVRQVGYENIRRLIGQLEDGIDQVDAAAREDVNAALAFGSGITAAFVGAADEEAAAESLELVWSDQQEDATSPGADWIAANCGVDIDG